MWWWDYIIGGMTENCGVGCCCIGLCMTSWCVCCGGDIWWFGGMCANFRVCCDVVEWFDVWCGLAWVVYCLNKHDWVVWCVIVVVCDNDCVCCLSCWCHWLMWSYIVWVLRFDMLWELCCWMTVYVWGEHGVGFICGWIIVMVCVLLVIIDMMWHYVWCTELFNNLY